MITYGRISAGSKGPVPWAREWEEDRQVELVEEGHSMSINLKDGVSETW